MKVSAVVSNYNYARFLPECIGSILEQTVDGIEIIVVDDGSTDNSRAVLESYGTNVKAIFQANGGQAAAINTGVAAATGDVICFLDSDDTWAPRKVERVLEVLRTHPDAGWVRHKARMVDEELQPLDSIAPAFTGSGIVPADPLLFIERIINSQPSTLAVRRDIAMKVFPIEITPDLAHDADDAVMLARIFRASKAGYSIDEVLGYYRRHPGERFGAHDIPKLLRREAAVTERLPRVFNINRIPSAAYKLRAILAAMDGAPLWSPRRIGPFVKGLTAAARLYSRPSLMTRQAAAVAFAYAAPAAWLRKLARSQNWPPLE